jgi:excinuclease ABC subunit C
VDKVGSMVVFIDGEPDKTSYRRFKIKTVEGNNDFACLKEVLKRRLDKLGTEEEENFPMPDLIIIDGGKGQLSSVMQIVEEFGITDIDFVSLAKREEEVFLPNQSKSILLPRESNALYLIQRIRDEAHRFAITFHRDLRSKALKNN